ncbi:MAG: hypothetical protein RDV41_14570 [Planctomycetota bacterium]|nr:hypothetical protein [Planctomycetota bacterium]
MARRIWPFAWVIPFLLVCGGDGFAELKKRWRLEFEGGEPRTFTYADPADNRTNLVYVIFKVTNKMDQDCPLMLDVTLRTNRGKFYRPRPMPGAEEQIVCQELKLGGYSVAERKERIAELKEAGRYVTLYEVALKKPVLKPGESIEVLACFPNVTYNIDELYIYVSGLVDVVKYNYVAARAALRGEKAADSIYEYENNVLMLTYKITAAESYVQFNPMEFVERKWLIMNFGPIADKETVKRLVDILDDAAVDVTLNVKEEEKNIGQVIKGTVNLILRLLTNQDFGYDASKSAEENEMVGKNAKEWWALNYKKLVFDEKKNVFHVPE